MARAPSLLSIIFSCTRPRPRPCCWYCTHVTYVISLRCACCAGRFWPLDARKLGVGKDEFRGLGKLIILRPTDGRISQDSSWTRWVRTSSTNGKVLYCTDTRLVSQEIISLGARGLRWSFITVQRQGKKVHGPCSYTWVPGVGPPLDGLSSLPNPGHEQESST